MKSMNDFDNPFQIILAFEQAVAKYTGAPYCVTTDCCSHAIEIAFRLAHDKSPVSFPAYTYLSVPMTLRKLGISYTLEDRTWKDSYQFNGSNIHDCARLLKENMYLSGSVQCLSFGMNKPLYIGRGGCLLTDNLELYIKASRMRFDGRDLFNYSPWVTQQVFSVGYHYYMRPEECLIGLNLLENCQFTEQLDEYYNYPDCRQIVIND